MLPEGRLADLHLLLISIRLILARTRHPPVRSSNAIYRLVKAVT
jgi:hypothetical protein